MQAGYILNNRYKISKFLTGSEMEQTWLAEDVLLKRHVDLIMFALALPEGEAEDNELQVPHLIQIVSQLLHPSIVPIFDVGHENNIFYIVVPHFEEELLSITQIAKSLTPTQMLPLFRQLASVLDTIHAKGFIHRDVKPDNIVVMKNQHLYLLNFAHFVAVEDDSSEHIVGTGAYIPPETLQSQPAGHLRDIWAFGLVLFECFTGEHPFNVNDMQTLMLDIVQKEIPSVRDYKGDLPEKVDAVIKRLLHRDPEKRYQTAIEAVKDLYQCFDLRMI